MLKIGQSGFSLAETLCGMAIVSLVLLSAMRLLPLMYGQCYGGIQHLRLVRQLDHSLLLLEKDLRRAGLCSPSCGRPAVTLSQRRGERPHSCLLVTYAFLPSSGATVGGVLVNETFGYRLRRGALETQRGVTHCDGPGWVNMHDPRLWVIKQVRFDAVADNAYRVTLTGAARSAPAIRHRSSRIMVGRNG
ncbi:prepilin-type N-terminal cleavage/methylation domain-containing protein [Sodalis sp. dw_96]|uniref:prepilin-type N-terminal cleavage/methylation domain-containing protein n=1 Tax=Sodalis sp. dw_96 TaxID=2719794 RepID=UPI001BD5CA6E|nr:prepilin-type N-terminal cleavage/methylation domain-containing protein [Sodalis sp. dw_96]